MSLNFRNFVQNTGPLFAILDAVEGVILWKSTPITILVVLLWTVLCLHPALVLILPQFSLICVILYNHSVRFPKEDIKVVDNDDAPAKHPSAPSSPTSPTSPTFPASPTQPTQPPPEPQLPDSSSPDYYLNLQSIQNLMGTTNDGIDYVMPIYRKLNWSDIEQSNGILKYTVVSLLATLILLPILPARLIFALGGYLVLALNHPLRKLFVLRGIAPLSAFTSLAISLITAVGISPSLSDINDDFYTHLTPKVGIDASQKEPTQHTMNVLGYQYVLSHAVHALWAICWILRSFSLAALLMGIQSINLALLYVQLCRVEYAPTKSRPLDYIFVHLPIRMWTVVTLAVDVSQSVFIAADYLSTPTWRFGRHQVAAVCALALPLVIGCAVVLIKGDHIWMGAHMWVLLALFLRHPKPVAVNGVCVAGWILLPLCLVGHSAAKKFLERRDELHRVRLEEDDESSVSG
ncbi:hypothetical protein E3P92_03686 [Wallemia ichthyophaga]|nr:hypothetical protein E3P92_03686 [Wallemia ichthyophaga]